MHQPSIPAGGEGPRSARLIRNGQSIEEHPDIGDDHDVPVFRWCYERRRESVPQLIGDGLQPE
jgi:hypothetical protein